MVNAQSKAMGLVNARQDLVDPGKLKKLAQRVEDTLSTMCLFAEPKQLDPSLVLVAPLNRQGAPPNKRHVHVGVLLSFKEKRGWQDQACDWHHQQPSLQLASPGTQLASPSVQLASSATKPAHGLTDNSTH